MSNEIISLLFENIQGLANESIDLEEFQESLEEFMEEFEYSLEDDDGMGTGTKVALGVGAAGAVGGAGYLTYKHLSKTKPVDRGVKGHLKNFFHATTNFVKEHGLKIAGALGAAGAAYGGHRYFTGDSRSQKKIEYHGDKAIEHSRLAAQASNYQEAGKHATEAMKHANEAKREILKQYKKGKMSKAEANAAIGAHLANEGLYHTTMAEMHSKHAHEAQTAEEAKKHADMAVKHAELAHAKGEKARSFLERAGAHELPHVNSSSWKEHLVNALHHFR